MAFARLQRFLQYEYLRPSVRYKVIFVYFVILSRFYVRARVWLYANDFRIFAAFNGKLILEFFFQK